MTNTLVIIFSKDRALQLQGVLDSFKLHENKADLNRMMVLYRASTTDYATAYQELKREQIGKLQITWTEEKFFKNDLLRTIRQAKPRPDFILFLVDDCIFTRSFRLDDLECALNDDSTTLGFSLRLGANTTFCYSENKDQRQPTFEDTEIGLRFQWIDQEGDFGYPLEISSSLYRWKDVRSMLRWLPYSNPNRLEQQLSLMCCRWRSRRPNIQCARKSLAFCAPVNLVQTVFNNRAGISNYQSPEHLNSLFLEGWRIDVKRLSGYTPIGCHEEINLPLHLTSKQPQGQARIAVVMCTLPNTNPNWLSEALQSTAAGLQEGDEIFLIIDGGSISKTHQQELHNRTAPIPLHIEQKSERQGLAIGLNHLIDKVLKDGRFELIARMDSDDVCRQDRFTKQRRYLAENKNVDIIGSWCDEIDEGGQLIQLKRVPVGHEGIIRCLPRRNILNHPTVVIRKEVFLSGLRYRSDVGKMEDYHLWITAAEAGWKLANIPEALLRFRRDHHFFQRRSGWRQATAEVRVRWRAMKALNQWSPLNFLAMSAAGFLRILPATLQAKLYRLRGAR